MLKVKMREMRETIKGTQMMEDYEHMMKEKDLELHILQRKFRKA